MSGGGDGINEVVSREDVSNVEGILKEQENKKKAK